MPPAPSVGGAPADAAIPLAKGGVLRVVEADGSLWVGDEGGVSRIDPATNAITGRVESVTADGLKRGGNPFAVADGSVWIADFEFGELRRYDSGSGGLQATIEVDSPSDITVADDGLWIANHRKGAVSRLDPATNTIDVIIEVGSVGPGGPHDLLIDGDSLWVDIPSDNTVARVDRVSMVRSGSTTSPTPRELCGPMAKAGRRLYVTSCFELPQMTVFDTRKLRQVGAVELPGFGGQPLIVGDQLWVPTVTTDGGFLAPFFAEMLKAETPLAVGGHPQSIIEAFGSFWLTVDDLDGHGWLLRLSPDVIYSGS